MSPAVLFQSCNTFAFLGWIMLIVLPRFPLVDRVILPVGACGLLGLLYLYLIVTQIGQTSGGFGSLDAVASLFANPHLLLAGWIHYLAFDLFIGCWEVRDARRRGIPHWLVVPALVLTFMFGPIGLVVYYLIRLARARRLDVDESKTAAH